MTKRALIVMFALAAIAVPLLTAQSNEVLDSVLAEATISYGNAAYLIGSATGVFPDTTAPGDAGPLLEQKGLGIPGRQPTDPVNLGDFSYMLDPGVRHPWRPDYMILPSPRYATRELSYLDIISGPAKPGHAALRGARPGHP